MKSRNYCTTTEFNFDNLITVNRQGCADKGLGAPYDYET